MLKFGKRMDFGWGKSLMDNTSQKYIEMKENGQNGEFVCGVSHWSPEGDGIDAETGTVQARGWRSLALLLVKKNICSLSRVRKVFSCPSLGESDYDHSTYEDKLKEAQTCQATR